MAVLSVTKSFSWQGKITEKVAGVMRMFGLTAERLRAGQAVHSCTLTVNDGDIVYITGPSGSGKSVLLKGLQTEIKESRRVSLNQIELSCDKALVDCIEGDFLAALRLLSITGLNDVFCVLNQPSYLSEGQKYRFQLAMAIAAGKRYVFADEFCSNLDRISACTISYNIRKLAKRKGITFILASSHEDVLADLQPDVLVIKALSGPVEVIYKETKR